MILLISCLQACGGGGTEQTVTNTSDESSTTAIDQAIAFKLPPKLTGNLTLPIIIGHRGASGYLPEHTLGAYELAVRMGADYIEPDLQLSKDGALVAMHDSTLERTTDVATKFQRRNGAYRVGDFNLAEIKTLRVLPNGAAKTSYAGFAPVGSDPWSVPTFSEVIQFAQLLSRLRGMEVGIYPEAKQNNRLMEESILATLERHGYTGKSKLFIQSFSDSTLRNMRAKQHVLNNPLQHILLGRAAVAPNGTAQIQIGIGATAKFIALQDITEFADGIGIEIGLIPNVITKDYIDKARSAGLKVHGFTFNKSNINAASIELNYYFNVGLDGIISDFPDSAYESRRQYFNAQ